MYKIIIFYGRTFNTHFRKKVSMQGALTTACRAARAGGAILRSYFGQTLAVQAKQGDDIVTEADLAAEGREEKRSQSGAWDLRNRCDPCGEC